MVNLLCMIRDLEHTVWIGLEYFCFEGDKYWNMPDEDFTRFAVDEIVRMGLIDAAHQILDRHGGDEDIAFHGDLPAVSAVGQGSDMVIGIFVQSGFYINRFGRKLYSMFFEYYTENLWGRHPREIAPDWGAQRVISRCSTISS